MKWDYDMIPALALVFACIIDEYRDALIWMSGSSDFGPDGQAGEHWAKLRERLI